MGSVQTERKGNYAIIWLAKEPVNLMGRAVWQDLKSALDALEADQQIRGVIFASGLKRDVFTAGHTLLHNCLLEES